MGLLASYAIFRKCGRSKSSMTEKEENKIREFKYMIREYEKELAKIYGVPKHLLNEVRDPSNESH